LSSSLRCCLCGILYEFLEEEEQNTKIKEKYDYEYTYVCIFSLCRCCCCYYYCYYDYYPSLIIRDSLFVDVFDAFNFVQRGPILHRG
jgi:hypothetical protein